MIKDLKKCIRCGNVHRDLEWLQKGLAFVPCYVANGAVGGCVDEFGFHSRHNFDMDGGRTHLTHVDHYSNRVSNGGHILRSFCHMHAEDRNGRTPGLGLLSRYEQTLDLWTASCSTVWEEQSLYKTHVFASWDTPQLWCWSLEQELANPDDALVLRLVFDTRDAENNSRFADKTIEDLDVSIEPAGDDLWKIVSKTDCCKTEMILHVSSGTTETRGSDIVIESVKKGFELKALFLDRHLPQEIKTNPGVFLKRDDHRKLHEKAVQKHWETSGMIELPEGTPEASWWPRFAYYLPASLSPNPSHIQVTTGLNANIWGHGFPQDQWYVMMPLSRLGLHDLTKAQLPYYNDDLDAYRRYTKRICKREGVFYPWAAPFEKLDEFETEGPTNPDTFQFHNAAYVLAMVWESYLVHQDKDFLKEHAGLIEGVAEFFAANCEPGENGYIFKNDDIPLRSQDEATVHGAETIQPLCSVWGSLYSFNAYIETCDILDTGNPELKGKVKTILEKGFDFSDLTREDGSLKTSATDPRPFGKQKHPPQLNPLTYVPMKEWMGYEPVVKSWNRRHELCKDTHVPTSFGWTLGQLFLASARMQDGAEAEKDLNLVQPARFADPDWIQFFESSCRNGWSHKKSYYFTVMGLYAMAMPDTLIQDYRDRIDLFPALLPRWKGKRVAFKNLHLRGGIRASGKLDGDRIELEFNAARETESELYIHIPGKYIINGTEHDLEKGDRFSLVLTP